jgi:hypothetical protein
MALSTNLFLSPYHSYSSSFFLLSSCRDNILESKSIKDKLRKRLLAVSFAFHTQVKQNTSLFQPYLFFLLKMHTLTYRQRSLTCSLCCA